MIDIYNAIPAPAMLSKTTAPRAVVFVSAEIKNPRDVTYSRKYY